MPDYTVRQGDCLSSIAARYGLDWQSIWNHGKNSQLKRKRKDPNILLPGDVLFVPDKEVKQEDGATESRHRFVRKSASAKLRLQLLDEERKPRANLRYVLAVDGALHEGTTDGEGRIEVAIPPAARSAKLTVQDGEKQEEFDLSLGHVDPISEVSGVQQRLTNLGFDCGGESGTIGERTASALRGFQKQEVLSETGQIDGATRQKLEEIHGS